MEHHRLKLNRKGLNLLGLGLKAGTIVLGSARVREMLKRDKIQLVVIANDLSRRTDEKVGRLARGKGVRIIEGPSSVDLGQRLGGNPIQAVGVIDCDLASGIVADAVERC